MTKSCLYLSLHSINVLQLVYQDGVKAAVGVSAKLDEVMNKQDSAWQEAVWRYLGTREGVMRVYPGIKFVTKYDPTIRTW